MRLLHSSFVTKSFQCTVVHTFYYVSTDVIGATIAAATGGVVGILLIIVVVVIVVCVLHLHKKVRLYISWCLHQLIKNRHCACKIFDEVLLLAKL